VRMGISGGRVLMRFSVSRDVLPLAWRPAGTGEDIGGLFPSIADNMVRGTIAIRREADMGRGGVRLRAVRAIWDGLDRVV
jgi:hypothetical protein